MYAEIVQSHEGYLTGNKIDDKITDLYYFFTILLTLTPLFSHYNCYENAYLHIFIIKYQSF